MDIEVTRRQLAFLRADADEVLYGGAAGGGKSYGQVLDAMLYALQYPRSKQLILRRTFVELEKSIIRTALEVFPREIFVYNASAHVARCQNGSLIDFGYCDSERDVYRYQSAEYDVIRFDELTHFTEHMYTYLISRVRGVNGFPKRVKSSTNPGGVGHAWVKKRFIDLGPPNVRYDTPTGSRIFIPASVRDNTFLMEKDPEYVRRLDNLTDEMERRALRDGDWDIFAGQYFPEFRRAVHVCRPFEIPAHWQRFRSLDYGFDCCCCLWWAVDESGRCVIYRELWQPGLILSDAARRILALTPQTEKIKYTVASPDLWNRRQDSGKSGMEAMTQAGLHGLTRADDRRVPGWRQVREYLACAPDGGESPDGTPSETPFVRIFDTCAHLIEDLPALVHDEHDPEDAAGEPHEHTHAPEAMRYGIMSRPPIARREEKPHYNFESERPKPGAFQGVPGRSFFRN